MGLLRESPLLLLFLVSSVGYLLGRVRVAGFSFGVAAVLFVGLGVGALDPALRLPEFAQQFGLALFVYTIGLGSGAGFFASLRRRGLRDLALVSASLGLAAALTVLYSTLAGLDASAGAGLFAGSLTNTPALAGVVDVLAATGASEPTLSAPVVAYSLAYPSSVIAVLLALFVARRARRDEAPPSRGAGAGELTNVTVRITHELDAPASALARTESYAVTFGRMRSGGALRLVVDDTRFRVGDLVSVVGRSRDLEAAIRVLGETSPERLDLDRSVIDYRRVFVSRAEACGRPLRELGLPARFGATITRVRRGDVDLLPDADTELLLGDRVRVVAPRDRLPDATRFLGDSYRALAEVDVLTFGLGIALGLLLGAIAVPLPGGGAFKLGIAGGPLIAGLVLGRLGRTGPLFWTLPFSANLTLRQIGLVLFLATAGTRSGHAFVSTLASGHGGGMVAAGALIALASSGLILLAGRRLGLSLDLVSGLVAGVQTQPAALAFAVERAENDQPNVGYAAVFPLATILKIVVAQLLLRWLG
jgi:putative transport protein